MSKSLVDRIEKHDFGGPPKADEVLAQIATRWLSLGRKADDRIPRDAFDLARWWMAIQKPPNEMLERPTKHSRRDGEGTFWKTPYIDRLSYTLKKFLSFEKDFQSLIISAAEDGIYWRGNDRDQFMRVIYENDCMKQNPEYRTQAVDALKKFKQEHAQRLEER